MYRRIVINNMAKTNRVVGKFDCRVWKKDTPRSQRKMVEKGGRVNLSVAFNEGDVPEDIKEFARFSEKSGKYYVTFKVFPKNCRIYTASVKQVEFPDYEKIDGGRFEVMIDYTTKHGTGTELNGCYANAIQMIRRADVPFDAIDGVSDNFLSGEELLSGDDDDDDNDDVTNDDLPF